jgi:asparagine N-glycosylation enzyme membrane subunit Stt3
VYGAHFLLLFALRQVSRFELIWMVPGAVFFALFYVAWPGYILGVLAVIVLLAVKSITRLRQPLAAVVLAGAMLVNCIQFYAVRPVEHPTSMAKAIATAYAFQYSRAAIVEKFQRRLKELTP